MGEETTGPGSLAPVSSSEHPWPSGHGGKLMVGSRSHNHMKESFGCFTPNPRGRKAPTALTSEQPTLEGPPAEADTSLLPGCVRPLAPTPQPTLALLDLTPGEGFPTSCPGLQLPPWPSQGSSCWQVTEHSGLRAGGQVARKGLLWQQVGHRLGRLPAPGPAPPCPGEPCPGCRSRQEPGG